MCRGGFCCFLLFLLLSAGLLFLGIAAIGGHNLLYERVTDNVFLRKLYERYSFYSAEHLACVFQATSLRQREVDLSKVARYDHLAAHTEAGEEHLDLRNGGVLRFIEDYYGIGERATAHESEGRNLNHALLHILLKLGLRQHVFEGIVERLQIGVDFLLHVARKETEFLAGFYGRAGKDDLADLLVLEGAYGERDGYVRLARTGRTDGEEQVGCVVVAQELLLIGRAGKNRLTVGAVEDEVVVAEGLRFAALDKLEDEFGRKGVVLNAESLGLTEVGFKLADLFLRAAHLDGIAAGHHTYLGVHVPEADDVLVVDAVKRLGVNVLVEFYYLV